jgi:hypothetical protein
MASKPKYSWEAVLGQSPITGKAVFEEMRVLPPTFEAGDWVKVTVEKYRPKVIQSGGSDGK